MAEPLKDAERKLRQLGERVRQGWAVQHPLSESELAAVRAVVKQQWGAQAKRGKQKQPPRQSQTKRLTQKQAKPRSHGHGHMH